MRLATITNWAYGATVALTLVSATTMLLASGAHEREREAVQQRHRFDEATSKLDHELYAMTENARQYVSTGDPAYELLYRSEAEKLGAVEQRIESLENAGASADELATLEDAIHWAGLLQDEQQAALDAYSQGDAERARALLFGPQYERELARSEALLLSFRDQLDQRTDNTVERALAVSRVWTAIAQVVLAITGLLFLFVLYFVFKQRVLRPVVKLSDVVNRLARQDYETELPPIQQIDEIGDIAEAVRLFRDNGLERQRMEAERAAEMRMRDLLSRMTQRMQGCDSMEDLKGVLTRFMPEIAPGRAGRLYILDRRRNAMAEACNWLEPAYSDHEFAPLACWALRRGMPHGTGGQAVDIPCDHIGQNADAELPDTLCLPLTAQRETLGLLYFERIATQSQEFEPPVLYLTMLAENIGLALSNLGLRETLHEMAMADPLTGLANRRQLENVLKHDITMARRSGMPVAALMIDVDHFKRFNDVFGHEAGDAVLREVGTVLQSHTRKGDFAFRYGGEEFLLLLTDIGSVSAAERAEEIRKAIGALKVEYDNRQLGAISASIGVASAPESCGYDQLVPVADGALLRAKASGRDQVHTARSRADSTPPRSRTA